MKVAYHLFAYRGDEHKLILSLKSLLALPGERHLVVIDDANNPCSPEARHWAQGQGIEWREDVRDRKQNLNGHEALEMILDHMIQTGAEVSVKLDADTLVLSHATERRFISSSCGFGGSDDRGSVYGAFYMVRLPVLKALRAELEAQKESLPDYQPEDQWMGRESRKITTFFTVPILKEREDGYGNGSLGVMGAVDYSHYPDCLEELKDKCHVITCGNALPSGMSRLEVLNAMQFFLL